MAVKTFGSERLTSPDINTYLANSGLVYITTKTFTSQATWDCTSVFSSTYDHYVAVVNCLGAPAGGAIVETRMLSGSTPISNNYAYYEAGNVWAGTPDLSASTSSAFMFGLRSAGFFFASMTIYNPYNPNYTGFSSEGVDNTQSWQSRGVHYQNTSYDGIRFSQAGAMTGTVTFYGYRKA